MRTATQLKMNSSYHSLTYITPFLKCFVLIIIFAQILFSLLVNISRYLTELIFGDKCDE